MINQGLGKKIDRADNIGIDVVLEDVEVALGFCVGVGAGAVD